VSALNNKGGWSQLSLKLETQPYRKLCVLVRCFARTCKRQIITNSHTSKCDSFARFCGCNCKTSRICYQQTRLSSPSKQGSDWHTSWDKQVCTYDTLWRQHYVTTSKEYLINSRILVNCFEVIFFQLHLMKILCTLVIMWVNYERKKKGSIFYETPCRPSNLQSSG